MRPVSWVSGITVAEDVVPLVIHQPSRIQPHLLVGFERDVGPWVVGMCREMETTRSGFQEA